MEGYLRGLLVVLRVVLAFALAFGVVLNAQTALAAQGFSEMRPASSEDASDSVRSASSSSSSSDSSLFVVDIGVFAEGSTRDAYAYASEGGASEEVRAVIDERGGKIDFDAALLWNDGGDWEYDSPKVSWRIDESGASRARISPAGVLEAAGTEDGLVALTAFVDGSYTANGKELAVTFKVELRGQTDVPYVTRIAICDDVGTVIDPSYRFEAGTLSTAMLELSARVGVYDPGTENEREYLVTSSSGLSAQTGGVLADLVWESADTRLGTVSEQGVYRPAVASTNEVRAVSTAGFNGSRVTARAVIDMPPAAGEEAANGYHPQNSLTVKVYYESHPDQVVAEKTFSVTDLENLGTAVVTYTALRGKEGYMTTTGRGPLLSSVLKSVGVNTAGIARLRFGTPDSYQGVVSWGLLVDSARYYFPHIDIGSYAEKVPVAPMVAIDAYRNAGSDVSAHADAMTDTRRFLLLFGAKDTGETTTNLQVYNIHTIYVELEGSPPVKSGAMTVKFVDSISGKVLKSVQAADPDSVSAPDPPTHKGYDFTGWIRSVDGSGNVTFTATYKKQGAAQPDGDAGRSGNLPGDGASGDDFPDGSTGSATSAGDHDLASSPDSVSTPTGVDSGGSRSGDSGVGAKPASASPASMTLLDTREVQVMTPGRYSMLQAINRHPSDVADLMMENPLAPYAVPTFAGLFAAGGLEAGLAYARQKRRPKAR